MNPFCMQAFYPFVLAYIVVAYVQGSLGSAGMLRSIRAWLWEPVSQDAYKYTANPHSHVWTQIHKKFPALIDSKTSLQPSLLLTAQLQLWCCICIDAEMHSLDETPSSTDRPMTQSFEAQSNKSPKTISSSQHLWLLAAAYPLCIGKATD